MRENPLVAFFVERFVFATSIFVGMVLVGLLLGLGLGVELLPRFSVPVIAISTSYPGAGPEEVAEQVSKPLEDALSTLTGVDVIGSSSTEGFSLVFVQFKQGVDVDQGAVEASQKVAAIRSTLPKDASAPVVQKFDPSASPILYLALRAPGRTSPRSSATRRGPSSPASSWSPAWPTSGSRAPPRRPSRSTWTPTGSRPWGSLPSRWSRPSPPRPSTSPWGPSRRRSGAWSTPYAPPPAPPRRWPRSWWTRAGASGCGTWPGWRRPGRPPPP